jgi:hypothetical protein
MKYYSVIVPWSDTPTEWHPTERDGPFATIARGAFDTREQAHDWAHKHLNGQPYRVKMYGGPRCVAYWRRERALTPRERRETRIACGALSQERLWGERS